MAEQIGVAFRLESKDFDTSDVRVHKFSKREAIGQLFQLDLEIAVFGAEGLDLDQVMGARVTLRFERDGLEIGHRHGIVSRVADNLETEREVRTYSLTVVPTLFAATLVETQEVFVDQTVPEIFAQKLDLIELGGAARELRLVETYASRDLVNQYRETDLAFLSRHCEHLGISMLFEHGEDADKLVLTDHAAGFPRLPEPLHFQPRGEKIEVFQIARVRQTVPRIYVAYDYNYRTPRVDVTGTYELECGSAGGVVEYGVHTKTPDESAHIAKIRGEERQSRETVYEGTSDICTIQAGVRFTLEGHALLDGVELLVVEVEHEGSQPIHLLAGSNDKPYYRNRFRAIPAERAYRPPRRTPWPRIWGVVTGVVQPNADGTVEDYAKIDEQGRYRIQFHFDTATPGRPKPSRWVRMAQPHSGPNYGMHFPLKPGVEVACVFVDGDPDRPLIVATSPNPVTRSPVTQTESRLNRLVTRSGVIMEIDDGIA